MRPQILNPLFSDITTLGGVGKKTRDFINYLLGRREEGSSRILDLLFHLPYNALDRTFMPDLLTAPDGKVITAIVEIEEYIIPPPGSKKPFRVVCKNKTGYLTLVYFNAGEDIIKRQLPLGQTRVISGKAERFDGILQIIHPEYVNPVSEIGKVKKITPIYPLTEGLGQKYLSKIITGAIKDLPSLLEWIEDNFLKTKSWVGWKESVERIHIPRNISDISADSIYRRRLAYDELLASQLALAISRNKIKKQTGKRIENDGKLRDSLIFSLPFSLTAGQKNVLNEIISDMATGNRMMRLLQGDVGSGKTIIALLAMIAVVENGWQAALMAPTDILCRQHFLKISEFISKAGLNEQIRIEVLSSREKGSKREEILNDLETGNIDIIIGTHALFQEKINFSRLALAVIDEQHRFGVKQRLSFSGKGENTHMLLMSATPIPRTLTLTFYGDMDISTLNEKPPGRQKIDTRIMPIDKADAIIERLKITTNRGNRVYWVCPLIEESENPPDSGKNKEIPRKYGEKPAETAAAETRYKYLAKYFGKRVGLVHGRMNAEERDKIMTMFKEGALDIIVATTVIEVGVDVPEATIMIIEQAERFGLAQLHQLRGRVGRGSGKSSCLLLYGNKISDQGKRRLGILRETEDGFRIAEEDLAMRGSGKILGTRQSGTPDFKLAILPEHSDLLLAARDDTKMIINSDPKLQSPRGQNLRILLYMFEYDTQIKYISAG